MFNIHICGLWIPVYDLDHLDTKVICPDINSYDLLTLDCDLDHDDTKVISPDALEQKEVESQRMLDISYL
jgi:hypothetical protein